MDLLEKVEKALKELEENKETEATVVLTFAELRGIRKDVLLAEYGSRLSAENLHAGLALRASRKGEGRHAEYI